MSLLERLRQPVTLPLPGRRSARGAADGDRERAARRPGGPDASPQTPEQGSPRAGANGSVPALRLGLRRRAPRPSLGVRIDVDAVRVAQAEVVAGHAQVRGFASSPLPEGAVRDGEVVEAQVVGEALRAAVDRIGSTDPVRIGVANQRVAARVVHIPPVDGREDVEAAVRFVAAEQLPVPLEGAVLDHVPLDVVETDDGPRRRVLVVAARREMIDGLVASARVASLRVSGIDLGAFALTRALPDTGARLLLDLGGVTTLAVADGDRCSFVRTIGAGIESIVAELSDRYGMPASDAMEAVHGLDLGVARAERSSEAEVAAHTLEAIAATVRHSLEFHRSEAPTTPAVVSCVLSGPLSQRPGVREVLAGELGLDVTVGQVDPAGQVDVLAAGLCLEEALA